MKNKLYFVTDGEYTDTSIVTNYSNTDQELSEVIIISGDAGLTMLSYEFSKIVGSAEPVFAMDFETTGLDSYVNDVLAAGICTRNSPLFAVDMQTVNLLPLLEKCFKDGLVWLNHNVKFDYKFLQNKGIVCKNFYDTMIADQRTTQNTGYSRSLVGLLQRKLGIVPYEMDKRIRIEFVGKTLGKFVFKDKHIHYIGGDVKLLFLLKDKLDESIKKYNMNFLLHGIEFPLIHVLAKGENDGVNINEEKWLAKYKKNSDLVFELESNMDKLLITYRDEYLKDENKLYLLGGKFDRERVRQEPLDQVDLFGNTVSFEKSLQGNKKHPPKVKFNAGNVNWGSSTQVVEIMAKLGFPLPNKLDEISTPRLNKKGKVTNDSYTTGKDALNLYVTASPDIPHREFIDLLITYNSTKTRMNTFGKVFLDNKNPVSKKFHTIYRQANAANSRFQSGGGLSQPDKFNSQNIPRDSEYRTCIYGRKGYKVVTADLSGAEVTIMGDKAKDKRLLALTNKDIHSHMATQGWKNIFLYRAGKSMNLWRTVETYRVKRKDPETLYKIENSTNANALEFIRKYFTYNVSKTENSSKRQSGKNLTFGSVYGCKRTKAAKTINVNEDEGQIYIDSIRNEIFPTFKYVENNVRLALKQGFLVINERTNSRVWFIDVIYALQNNAQLDWKAKKDIDGAARNIPISGTQADMIKEVMVVMDRKIDEEHWDANFMMQVHDELVYDIHPSQAIEFGKILADVMVSVPNKYLSFTKMGVDYSINDTWIKD